MFRYSALALIGSAVVMAACTDSSKVTQPARQSPSSPSFSEVADNAPARHILHRNGDPANDEAHTAGGKSSGTGIYYHGGPLLTQGTNVAAVYWAAAPIYNLGPVPGTFGSPAADLSLVGYFLANLGGSRYFNINTTYYNGSSVHVQNVVHYTQYWANNTLVPANGQSVSDAQMISMLQSGFNSGALTYDPSTLYIIFTAGTVNLGGGFGTQYCAYHSSGTVSQGTVLYAAMPYTHAYPSACTNGTAAPNGDPAADAEVNVVAHETEETTTDYLGNAWYDRRGYENADKCAWNFGATYTNTPVGTSPNLGVANMVIGTKNFLVQQNWINAGSGGCRLSY